ncbi:MAG: dTDP-glucose 4,6-dehydratase [Pseudomonadota bacterium]
MANLLVTGGAGFIGANYVRHHAATHPADRIVVLDALTYAGNLASIQDVLDGQRVLFVHGDIGDEDLVHDLLSRHDVDTLVHFAAESHVDRSILGPDAFVQTNIVGTHALLKAARKAWLGESPRAKHRFHHVSTDEVFGSLGPHDSAFSESTPYAPNSPYAATKAGSDFLVRAYQHTYGLATTMTNCSNNYGPYQFPEKLIPLFIIRCLEGGNLPIYGDGMNVRDWLFVEDHCRGIDAVLERGAVGETYNIGGRCELPNLHVIEAIVKAVDEAFAADASLKQRFPQSPAARGASCGELKTYVTDRPGHDRRYAIDPARIEAALDFIPAYRFSDALARTVRWYLDNEPWWRAIQSNAYRSWVEANYTGRGG